MTSIIAPEKDGYKPQLYEVRLYNDKGRQIYSLYVAEFFAADAKDRVVSEGLDKYGDVAETKVFPANSEQVGKINFTSKLPGSYSLIIKTNVWSTYLNWKHINRVGLIHAERR